MDSEEAVLAAEVEAVPPSPADVGAEPQPTAELEEAKGTAAAETPTLQENAGEEGIEDVRKVCWLWGRGSKAWVWVWWEGGCARTASR